MRPHWKVCENKIVPKKDKKRVSGHLTILDGALSLLLTDSGHLTYNAACVQTCCWRAASENCKTERVSGHLTILDGALSLLLRMTQQLCCWKALACWGGNVP